MKKLIILLLFAVAVWIPGGFIEAAYNDFQTDGSVTVNISDLGINLTISSGAKIGSMVVGTGTVTFAVESGSTATVTSSDRRTLTASGFGNDTQFTCPATGSSTLTIEASATRTGVITPSATDCSNTIASSGGGGGGTTYIPAPTIITPSNPSVSISAGATEATLHDVVLTLSATNASQMMISNNESFSGGSWETYATSKNWTLASGLGKKTVYAKFQSSSGGISALATDDIMLLPAPAVKGITASAGGHVGLSDDLVAVDLPANAVAKNTNISITPTSVYTAPTGKTKIAGSQIYDFKGEANGASVKNFSKELTLTFKYTSDDIKGLSEGSLAVYYWDEAVNAWVKVGGTVDKVKKTVTAKVNHFTLFAVLGEESAAAGQLVKLKCDASNKSICTAVYYIGNDGKRYVFPTEKTYLTWYSDFSGVKEISATELAAYRIGGNVTYKPGVKMIKITSDPKVYAISKGGVLKEIGSEAVAKALYGATWNKQIDDLPDSFFINYTIGKKISASTEFTVETEKSSSASVNDDKGL